MAFLGADTDELREAAQKCQEGKETTDQVITFVKALIALLRAASFFTGGASAAYATFLETQVVPWLEKISMALGMFAQVLGANAQAQDQVSAGETVDFSKLPTYTSPLQTEQNRAPMGSWQGGSIAPTQPLSPGTPGTTTTTTSTTTTTADGVTIPGTTTTVTSPTGLTPASITPTIGIPSLSDSATGAGSTAAPVSEKPALGGALPTGSGSGGGTGGGTGSGTGGGTGGGTTGGGGSPALGGGSIDGGSVPSSPTGGGSPDVAPSAGTTPGAESLTSAALNPTGDSITDTGEKPSYGAAAGLAGGAAALGLGGAALAGRGNGGDAAIEKLAGENGRGSRGEDVRELQQRLSAAGYDTQGADGVWGSNTQAAYEAWRSDHPQQLAQGSGFSSPTGYDYQQIQGVSGNPNVTPEFLREVEAVAGRLGAAPEHLMATMSFETGGRFTSDVENPRSGATGLIQFMPDTARGLGTTTEALSRMTPTEQLSYVERYFEPYRGRLDSLESVYTSVLGGRPMDADTTMFNQGTQAYHQNRELDVNGDGRITAAEATSHVRSRMGG
ncbi:peptidoglycan-binding domain-containing protein [Nocardioides zeae]|uniref:Peptidoglycan-binding domain-containing protein n=1 Tax=Nocardioides imazamoxiresistens TaxID=3231893 RepID=A0ABU3PRN5_9ACTN|nr:peptidoglycan-binding domain-containing protein [Nocardioides zeae]MDT9591877.1 peptidoglycan-binding domain-containing protein [Nocardioides zeae]